MIAVAFMTVFPLYFILITAFKTRKEYLTNEFLPPSHPTLVNLREAFRDGQLLTWIGNSVVITVVERRAGGDRVGARRLSARARELPRPAAVHRAQHRAHGRAAGGARRPAVPVLRQPRPRQLAARGGAHLHRAADPVLDLPARELLRDDPAQPRGGRQDRRRGLAARARARRRPALGALDRHGGGRQHGLGLERAADRAGLPAGRQRAHADRRADVLPGALPVERAARDDGRADRDASRCSRSTSSASASSSGDSRPASGSEPRLPGAADGARRARACCPSRSSRAWRELEAGYPDARGRARSRDAPSPSCAPAWRRCLGLEAIPRARRARVAGARRAAGRRLHDRERRLRGRARARSCPLTSTARRPRARIPASCTRSGTGWRTRGSSPTSSASTRAWRGPGCSCSPTTRSGRASAASAGTSTGSSRRCSWASRRSA